MLPAVGAVIKSILTEVQKVQAAEVAKSTELPDFLKPLSEQAQKKLSLIVKADSAGSLEAITQALGDRVAIVGSGIGDITEADVLLARPSNAFIVGFNVKAHPGVEKLAITEKVVYRTYTIIYELLDELEEVISGMKEVITKERELGMGKIIAEFPFEKTRIAGTKVVSGRLARGDMVKLMRGETEVLRAKIKSIRHGKEDITKVETNAECGILFDRTVDFQLGDDIIAVTVS